MNEIQFHKEQITLCTQIIEGALAHNRFIELYMEMNPVGHVPMIDTLLQSAKRDDEYINCFSRLYLESEQLLTAKGIDPYPPLQQKKEKNSIKCTLLLTAGAGLPGSEFQ
jgi:hypothetical protein